MTDGKLKMKPLSVNGTKEVYRKVCEDLGLNHDLVPTTYITLAAYCARDAVEAFCRENDLEYPVETLQETLGRMVEAGVIAPDDVEALRAAYVSINEGSEPD